MEYTQEVIERIRATKDQTDYRSIGADLARRWITELGTFREIKTLGSRSGSVTAVNHWIRQQCPDANSPDVYYGFCEEVRRFWDQYKNDL